MTRKQIQSCTDHLSAVDPNAAERFALAMREAATLHTRASVIRPEAWKLYWAR